MKNPAATYPQMDADGRRCEMTLIGAHLEFETDF